MLRKYTPYRNREPEWGHYSREGLEAMARRLWEAKQRDEQLIERLQVVIEAQDKQISKLGGTV